MAIKNLSRGLIDSNKLSSAPGFFKIQDFFSLPVSAGNWAEDQNMFWDSGQIDYSIASFRFGGGSVLSYPVGPVFPLALLTFTNKKNTSGISSPMFFIPKKPTLVEYLLVGGGGNGGTTQSPYSATTHFNYTSGKMVGPGGGGGGGIAIGQIALNPGSVFSINVGDSEENTTLSVHEISSTGVNSKVLVVAFAGGRGGCLNSSGKIDTYPGGNGGGAPNVSLYPQSGSLADDYAGYTNNEIGTGWYGGTSWNLRRSAGHAGGSGIPYFFPLNGSYSSISTSAISPPVPSHGNRGYWNGTSYGGGTGAIGGSPGAVVSGNSFTTLPGGTSSTTWGGGIYIDAPDILTQTLTTQTYTQFTSYVTPSVTFPGFFSVGGSAASPDGVYCYSTYSAGYGTSYSYWGGSYTTAGYGAPSSFFQATNGMPNSGGGGGATNQSDSSYAGKGGSGIAYVRWGLR